MASRIQELRDRNMRLLERESYDRRGDLEVAVGEISRGEAVWEHALDPSRRKRVKVIH